jgi:flagella basal body P-ring formation protein FlgA
MTVPGEQFTLLPSTSLPTPGRARVIIRAVQDGKEIASTVVECRHNYSVTRAVATADIAAGALVSPHNVRIETHQQETPADGEFVSPVGMILTNPVQAGTVLRPTLLKTPSRDVVVKRDNAVQMRISGTGFSLLALGKAMEDGRVGDYIKVRNVDSQRVVLTRVSPDGSVEPVMRR